MPEKLRTVGQYGVKESQWGPKRPRRLAADDAAMFCPDRALERKASRIIAKARRMGRAEASDDYDHFLLVESLLQKMREGL